MPQVKESLALVDQEQLGLFNRTDEKGVTYVMSSAYVGVDVDGDGDVTSDVLFGLVHCRIMLFIS